MKIYSLGGSQIKAILSKHQENVVVRKSVMQYYLETPRPDFNKELFPEKEQDTANIIDLNRFKEKNNQPPALSRNEILLQNNVPVKGLDSIRDVFIQKYRQTQGNLIYFKNNPAVEVKI